MFEQIPFLEWLFVSMTVRVVFVMSVFVRMRCSGMDMFVRVGRFAILVRMFVMRVVMKMLVRVRHVVVFMFVFMVGHFIAPLLRLRLGTADII